MDGEDLLRNLRGVTEFEVVGDQPQRERPVRSPRLPPDLSGCVTQVTAGSRKIPLLKALTTTACERDCFYCPFRAGRTAMRRITFSPDDMAQGFMALHRAGVVEGVPLVRRDRGGVTTRTRSWTPAPSCARNTAIAATFTSRSCPAPSAIRSSGRWAADRVSINLEAPNARRLAQIAPGKDFDGELLERLRWVTDLRRESGGRLRASSTTEFVVGPAGERDLEILSMTGVLYRQLGLARTYYSAFRPVLDTPLDNMPATDSLRQLRLYQASFLLRDYGFDLEELPFEGEGDLPQQIDPKRAWADLHLLQRRLLARRAAADARAGAGRQGRRIVAARRKAACGLADLRAVGVVNVNRQHIAARWPPPRGQPRLFCGGAGGFALPLPDSLRIRRRMALRRLPGRSRRRRHASGGRIRVACLAWGEPLRLVAFDAQHALIQHRATAPRGMWPAVLRAPQQNTSDFQSISRNLGAAIPPRG